MLKIYTLMYIYINIIYIYTTLVTLGKHTHCRHSPGVVYTRGILGDTYTISVCVYVAISH